MAVVKITMKGRRCERCGHTWVPRGPKPRICPKCKSAWWDVPKKGNVK